MEQTLSKRGPLSTQTGSLPQPLPKDSIILVAAPSQAVAQTLCYRLWCHHLIETLPSLFVTTDSTKERVQQRIRKTGCDVATRQIGIVDSHSKDMGVVNNYERVPVIYVEDSAHITQLFVSIYEMRDQILAAPETHILVPYLTPIIKESSSGPLLRALETALSSDRTGTGVLGIDYTMHDPETTDTLEAISDRTLWAEKTATGEIQLRSYGTHRAHQKYRSDQ
ncbi:hypothetical protein [Haloarcula nitratireducens]|uniref:Uncharacterized protein n=1 Tax=Haloarcula nitratireducens TaxID=2487749 RepID=A0AAW4PJ96_9EURY|nr:hypothetical protein [Halomicroarcula nitratireducens]MBX0298043.1 hypothetical protein [Halomicroarcula nitratireducens]